MLLTVYVQPGAKQNQIVGWVGDEVKIRITAPPREGRANKALIDFLADRLGVPKTSIEIIRGMSMKMKQLEIPLSEPEVRAKLKADN